MAELPDTYEQQLAQLHGFAKELVESSRWNQVGDWPDEPGWMDVGNRNRFAAKRGGAFSYIYDRADGRFLPYYENEWDLRRQRVSMRNLAGFTSVAIGAVETLNAYVIGTGYKFRAKARDESQEHVLKPIIDKIQLVIDRFLEENRFLGSLDKECHIDSREDGEKILALYPQDGYVARVMVIEPDELTEPANPGPINRMIGIDDQWSHWEFGVHTRYNEDLRCHDTETPLHYHVVRDDAGMDWDYLPADRVVHIKRNVPRKAKRGVSDFLPMVDDLDGEDNITTGMRECMRILASIPFIKEKDIDYEPGISIPGADQYSLTLPTSGGGARTVKRQRYHPGTVPELRGMKYQAGPLTQMRNDALVNTLNYLLKRIGMFWTLPGFMMGAESGTHLYSSVLAIGSPFVIRREQDQIEMGEKFVELIEKALKIAWETGQISGIESSFGRLMNLIEIDYEAPRVALTNEKEQSEAIKNNVEAGVMSIQTAQEQTGLDPEKEATRSQAIPDIQQAIESMTDPVATADRLIESGQWGNWA